MQIEIGRMAEIFQISKYVEIRDSTGRNQHDGDEWSMIISMNSVEGGGGYLSTRYARPKH